MISSGGAYGARSGGTSRVSFPAFASGIDWPSKRLRKSIPNAPFLAV
jgi:hypothetical protein